MYQKQRTPCRVLQLVLLGQLVQWVDQDRESRVSSVWGGPLSVPMGGHKGLFILSQLRLTIAFATLQFLENGNSLGQASLDYVFPLHPRTPASRTGLPPVGARMTMDDQCRKSCIPGPSSGDP